VLRHCVVCIGDILGGGGLFVLILVFHLDACMYVRRVGLVFFSIHTFILCTGVRDYLLIMRLLMCFTNVY
jgi:hypothetical protein